MRVSDAERATVVGDLCRHHADGRLDEHEFDERVAAANAAKTRADLAPLLRDLPPFELPATPSGEHRHRAGWAILLSLVVLVGAASFAAIAVHGFAPRVPWLPVVVVVALVLRQRHHRRHWV